MRLITCSKNTITSPISQFAFSLIKELRTTIKNSVTNTTNLVNTISQITVENKEKLASLDIEDMFTNIPITRAVDIAINSLQTIVINKNRSKEITHVIIKQQLRGV